MLYALCEEAEVYRTVFEKEKELIDRALKLAEAEKPKSNWELQGLLGLTALIMYSWKGDNQYEKPEIHKKKAPCPFRLNWQVVLEPTFIAPLGDAQRLQWIEGFLENRPLGR